MENIIKSDKKSLYCIKKKGIINFSIYRIRPEDMYGEGNYDASLSAMEKNIKFLIKDLQERLEIVSKTKANLRQMKLF